MSKSRASKLASSGRSPVTVDDLNEARRGVERLLLSKHFPREWIERHIPDLMDQALVDFSARLAAGQEDRTVGLLVVIAYRRATKTLDTQIKGPAFVSTELIFHLVDEVHPTPEEETIEKYRRERVAQAMSHLPERERQLMTLVYFEGMSIREAGRQLGLTKSTVDRHHRAACNRLEKLLDRGLTDL